MTTGPGQAPGATRGTGAPGVIDFALGRRLGPAVEARLAGLDADRLPARLWARDPTLWAGDPARHP
ncbi:MAG: hypothetical protein ACRENJ_05885, partial [Candidatus Eiseniibacteriota bacterium]